MKSNTLTFIGFIWKSNRILILFGMAFVAVIQLLLIYFNSTLDIAPVVEVMLSQFPPNIREMFGDEILSQISAEGTVAFGLEHPLVITLFTFISIGIVSRNIGTGSGNPLMEILLAHPFRRQSLFNAVYFFSLFVLALLVFSAFIGSYAAIYLFHEMDREIFTNMVKSDANAYLLHAFIMSLTMFFSVYFKDMSRAILTIAILTLVFYFLDIISDLWDALAFTKHINFFSYFDPPEIMIGKGTAWFDMSLLGILSLILYLVSHRIFLRKDVF
jgi:ABC-type transport system involved in multi-copper enzyme maturation permease subunit